VRATHWVIDDSFVLSTQKIPDKKEKLFKTITIFYVSKGFLRLNTMKDLKGTANYPNHVRVTQDQHEVIGYIFDQFNPLS
jgi:hypothetical protein